ncbi:hypothetical protein JCM15093_2111 [Bacteroides graminisolvens DSM 19988 = JCM 15093]|uniref:Nudix hydrolase domain-containing protein n=1 Tax=Bacteroides graminisolvens DSM 19988 = JCM 15093 TaxID=1121097 RepID=A0A069D3A6_9BACE|nr:hypothetical protein JCM15093_2111 [Bacteroides graminisolvens DSM 19988 = JCM 15093]
MGGFLQKDESLDQAAKRVLYELTGLEKYIWIKSVSSVKLSAILVNGFYQLLIMH